MDLISNTTIINLNSFLFSLEVKVIFAILFMFARYANLLKTVCHIVVNVLRTFSINMVQQIVIVVLCLPRSVVHLLVVVKK